MGFKTEYIAISKNSVEYFNTELKIYTDKGYEPVGSLSSSLTSHEREIVLCYSILLSKTIETKK